jgi:hypothetical protein
MRSLLSKTESEERVGELASTLVPNAKGEGPREIARAYLLRKEVGIRGEDVP